MYNVPVVPGMCANTSQTDIHVCVTLHLLFYTYNLSHALLSFRWGDYKLIEGSPGHYRDWYHPVLQGNDARYVKLNRAKHHRHLSWHVNSTMLFNLRSESGSEFS